MDESTAKQFNAIKYSCELCEQAGVHKAEFYIEELQDHEVEEIAKDNKVVLYRPTHMNPYFWCGIHVGKNRIYVSGKQKEVEFTEPLLKTKNQKQP